MESRVAVLRAVAEALFPPLEDLGAEAAAVGDPAAALFRQGGASDEVIYQVVEIIETRLHQEARRELYLLLRLLASRLGSLLLLGRSSFSGGVGLPCPFPALPLDQREAVLLGWSRGSDARMRKAFKALKSLLMSAQFTNRPCDADPPLLQALAYPAADRARPAPPAPPAAAAEAAVAAALADLAGHDATPGSAAGAGAALAAKGLRVLWPGDFGSAALARERPQLAVQCDVVVVGSGAGGGVAAANLARAGLRVVVLERAGLVAARDMSQQEGQAFQAMYEAGGFLASEDATVSVLAGSTLGGGTRVNWCASFRTPPHVRREWAEEHGLPAFASPEYEEALDAVCARLGVRTGFKHSAMCSTLAAGLRGVSAHCAEVPRNCLEPDCSGSCCLGCARGYKQDAVNTWLADACQAGARVITGAWAERVILEPVPASEAPAGGGHARRRRAAGVLVLAGAAGSPLRLAVKAPIVVSAAGSIHTPALLLRSGVSCRGNVGANLRLHPCTCVVGVFPPGGAQQPEGQQRAGAGSADGLGDLEDLAGPSTQQQRQQQQGQQEWQGKGPRPGSASSGGASSGGGSEEAQRRLRAEPSGGSIRCWEGTLMSMFSTQVGDWEGSGYGALLYTPAVHPGLFAAASPWVGGADYKRLLLQYPNCCVVLVLTRDAEAGRVTVDRSGRPRIQYSLSKRDEASMLRGMELGLRCMAAAGAQAVLTMLNSPAGRFTFTQPPPADAAPAAGGQQAEQRAGGAGEPGDALCGSAGAPLLPVVPGSASGGSPEFEAYLSEVADTGVVPLQMPLFSAHQMGSCRLGADPKTSALDPSGECWDAAGLYCLDGSAFPTPTGVNPMISIESISYMLSKRLAGRLVGGGGPPGAGSRRRSPGSSKL